MKISGSGFAGLDWPDRKRIVAHQGIWRVEDEARQLLASLDSLMKEVSSAQARSP
jgi:hypothetical protein